MRAVLFFLITITGVTSFISGLLMISKPDGSILNAPLSLLEESPFTNYFIPGILLAVLVGGVNLIAVFLNIQKHPARYTWAGAGGVMICGWIIIQMLLINMAHWLHFIYLGMGLLIILIAYQLKGKWAV